MKQIICIKWGTAYGAEDVNVLYGMVSRNITGPFGMFCFTDDKAGIRPEVKCMPLPDLGCEIPPDVPGKWPKIALWGKELFGMEGVALFIDLDSVIVGNIDCYFEYGESSDVITARNWLKKFSKSAQTSVFRFPIGANPYMLGNLQADPAKISRKYQYEQNYVTHNVRGGIKFWPEQWTRHFRLHCMGSLPFRYLRTPILPEGAKIITFPGLPGPADAARGRWSERSEAREPHEHLATVWQAFRGGKPWKKHLSRYVRRAPWLDEHWHE